MYFSWIVVVVIRRNLFYIFSQKKLTRSYIKERSQSSKLGPGFQYGELHRLNTSIDSIALRLDTVEISHRNHH